MAPALITLTGNDTEFMGRRHPRKPKPQHPRRKAFIRKALKVAPWVIAPGAAASVLAAKKIQEAAKRRKAHNERIKRERRIQQAQAAARAREEAKRRQIEAERKRQADAAAAAAAQNRAAPAALPAPQNINVQFSPAQQQPSAQEYAPEAETEQEEQPAEEQEQDQEAIEQDEQAAEEQATAGFLGAIARRQLPAIRRPAAPALPPAKPANIITKATTWAKANPAPAAGLAAAAIFLAWNLSKKKK